ncbi:hypothetical protein OG21DRAFT_1104379 [Imleria badia]|nr:hypothetical protein OG21DRAFT_1104379 [Imleria badia]
MPPLECEQAAFAKHLFIQGYPLWNPDPAFLPQGLQSVGLQIGDVGTVDDRGHFRVFFNILDPPPGGIDTPSIFPPIEENYVRCSTEDISPRGVVSSPETSWDIDLSDLDSEPIVGISRRTTHYSATLSNDGAHIILPQGAQSFELGLQHRRLFENHAREHGADWLERFRDQLGSPRSNSLYLLTGFYKTCSWSIASFGMKTAANTDPVGVHCTLAEVDERIIRDDSFWRPAGRFRQKIGPAPDRQGKNNQTVFIRGITITPNLSEPEKSEKQAGLLSVLSVPTRLLSTLAGSSAMAATTETSKSNVIIQDVPQISQASHPSEIINQYLLTK